MTRWAWGLVVLVALVVVLEITGLKKVSANLFDYNPPEKSMSSHGFRGILVSEYVRIKEPSANPNVFVSILKSQHIGNRNPMIVFLENHNVSTLATPISAPNFRAHFHVVDRSMRFLGNEHIQPNLNNGSGRFPKVFELEREPTLSGNNHIRGIVICFGHLKRVTSIKTYYVDKKSCPFGGYRSVGGSDGGMRRVSSGLQGFPKEDNASDTGNGGYETKKSHHPLRQPVTKWANPNSPVTQIQTGFGALLRIAVCYAAMVGIVFALILWGSEGNDRRFYGCLCASFILSGTVWLFGFMWPLLRFGG